MAENRVVYPPKANAAFVCNMEDVLDVYKRPYTHSGASFYETFAPAEARRILDKDRVHNKFLLL